MSLRAIIVLVGLAVVAGCSNTPYPGGSGGADFTYYVWDYDPPKNLDPQGAYSERDDSYLNRCYEKLLTYDYLNRPLEVIPELAIEVPTPEEIKDADGNVSGIRYHFAVQPGVMFIDDPCFTDGKGREMTIRDFEFAFKRVADPTVNCPIFDSLAKVKGLREYRERLAALRQEMTAALAPGERLKTSDLYAEAGPIDGVRVTGNYEFDLVLADPYPQILYWLASKFICAVPWEAVDRYYKGRLAAPGEVGPQEFGQRPVGTGPFRFKWEEYDRESRIVLVRNFDWWGTKYPDRRTAYNSYPIKPGSPEDEESGIWNPDLAGKPLDYVHRVEYIMEPEQFSRFHKFVQGYYDTTSIPTDMFNQVVQSEMLTPELAARDIELVKDIRIEIRYLGFNMQDDIVGAPVKFSDPALEAKRDEMLTRNRKLRQAMSLAISAEEYLRIFLNGLGIPAHSPLPPGIFGYDPDYVNPYRVYEPELKKAKELLREAGYENGIDPATGKPLKLRFDVGSTETWMRTQYNFFIDSWRKLGLDVEMQATDYNKFQEKMQTGNFQIFFWGWLADYPDAENFMFLLYGPNSGKYGRYNPNQAWYENNAYDRLFEKMETLRDDGSATWTEVDPTTGESRTITKSRGEIIDDLVDIAAEESPWIPLYFGENYRLYHAWVHGVKRHPMSGSFERYYTFEPEHRKQSREAWNQPVRWPAAVAAVGFVIFLIPAIITIRRERR